MTTPHYADGPVTVWHGDCIDVMRQLPDQSVDAVCTDPPYALEFMGHGWDRYTPGEFQHWCEEWAAEAYRLLKPGGHLLAFGGTRTFHRLASGIEDAGFEIRDSIAWLYGSGFPKSLDVSKAIDRTAGAEREVIGKKGGRYAYGFSEEARDHFKPYGGGGFTADPSTIGDVTAPATEDAARWNGWGTALKPAFEPIVVARKPLTGTVAANVLTYGTGALNIDGSRIDAATTDRFDGGAGGSDSAWFGAKGYQPGDGFAVTGKGRWPANVVLDASQAAALDQQSGVSTSEARERQRGTSRAATQGASNGGTAGGYNYGDAPRVGHVDSGGASRFFKTVDTVTPRFMYTAKAGSDERPKVTREGAGNGRVTGLGGKVRQCNVCGTRSIESGAGSPSCGHDDFHWAEPTSSTADVVSHPTVKPLDLMRWLVKLVTPPGGTVLEPFAGSGTTVEAAVLEGFHCIAIEREADYLPLILQRIRKPHAVGLDLGGWDDTPAPAKPKGRWPANVVLSESQAERLDEQSGERRSAGDYPSEAETDGELFGKRKQGQLYADTGGASRFFKTVPDPEPVAFDFGEWEA